jgi:hypothetical protein
VLASPSGKPEACGIRSIFFLFNSNNYTIYPSDMDNKYIFCLIYSNGKFNFKEVGAAAMGQKCNLKGIQV